MSQLRKIVKVMQIYGVIWLRLYQLSILTIYRGRLLQLLLWSLYGRDNVPPSYLQLILFLLLLLQLKLLLLLLHQY